MKKFTVEKNSSLKEFTDSVYPQGSFALNRLLKRGDVRVNGVKVHGDCPVEEGDEVVYYTTPAEESKPSHNIIYEDANVIIADKLSGVSCEALFCELKEKGDVFPVHRLDRNTCGLIAVARNKNAERELSGAFKDRRVDKVYLCLCKSAFKEDKGLLTAYLSKDEKEGKVRIYASSNADRVKIVTEYEVVKNYGDYSLVKVTLHTGKTHQIRAHMAFIGCPVLGDGKYGDGALNKKYKAARQILVAKYLSFELCGELSYLSGKKFESPQFPKLPENR